MKILPRKKSVRAIQKISELKRRGKFVVIEGGTGSGKTTQINYLKKVLTKGWKFYREPGSTVFGEKVRDAVQGLHKYSVDEYAAFFAYSAARANLVRKVITPNLINGVNVILDRYWYSTYAYQGVEVNKSDITSISKIATADLVPDLIIYYDVDPRVGIKRKSKNKDADRYDIKEVEFHKRVRKNYHALSKKLKSKWVTIDASKDIRTLEKETLSIIKKKKII